MQPTEYKAAQQRVALAQMTEVKMTPKQALKEWGRDWQEGDWCDQCGGLRILGHEGHVPTKRLPLPGGAGAFLCQPCWIQHRMDGYGIIDE